MILLGVNMPDRRLVKIALTAFHGISHSTARLICARLAFHDRLTVAELSEPQINALNSLLSAPSSFMQQQSSSSSSSKSASNSQGQQSEQHQQQKQGSSSNSSSYDRLANLVIESDLRKKVRADIAHHRAVGSYRGRRHAMHLPVRGQRTKTNAKTARKLNRVERTAFHTWAAPSRPLQPYTPSGSAQRFFSSSSSSSSSSSVTAPTTTTLQAVMRLVQSSRISFSPLQFLARRLQGNTLSAP